VTGLNLDTIECADVMDYLRGLPDACVNLVCTSPPYFNLRSYLEDGHEDKAREIGTEQTPAAYVARMVDVFREVRRVLRPDGNVYVNLGDSYASSSKGTGGPSPRQLRNAGSRYEPKSMDCGVPDKSLMLIPHRFAIAMQDDGWLLREDIVWQKPNPMPESVRDRCTRSHEYIFHFTKGPRYWYDAQAVAEEAASDWVNRGGSLLNRTGWTTAAGRNDMTRKEGTNADGSKRNRRSVWTINPANFREAHFATFPEDIPEICIKAACPEWCCDQCGAPYEAQVEIIKGDRITETTPGRVALGKTGNSKSRASHATGWQQMKPDEVRHNGYAPSCTCNAGKRAGVVLDPFAGAGTVGLVAKKLNRRYIGCDLNAEYVKMAADRINGISYTLFSLMEVTGD
jgi:DNA modification methylase